VLRAHPERAAEFLARHRAPGTFVLPNVWDPGSARVMEDAGLEALATTSAGIAFAAGLPDDGRIGRDAMLERVAAIAAAVQVPVSADIEAGYATAPGEVATTIRAVIAAGAVGANLEDGDPSRRGSLYDVDQAAERVSVAREAADGEHVAFTLNARIDSFLVGHPDALADVAERAARYVEAGADCIFVPGVSDRAGIAEVAGAIDAPLNVVAGLVGEPLDLQSYRALGVRRVSIGGSLARATLALVRRAANDMLGGTFGFAGHAIPHGELNDLMGSR
jgi:2-methylisocitrate lyase-like PEP mutase family enzyme